MAAILVLGASCGLRGAGYSFLSLLKQCLQMGS
jgi:hypothetical protein